MWTVWCLENDHMIRRLHEDPGIIGEGGTGAPLGSLDCLWDPEFFSIGPGTETGARRRCRNPEILYSGDRTGALMHLDPEVAWEPGGSLGMPLRPCWNPEVWIRRSFFWNLEEPGDSSLDHEIFDWNPEAIGEPGGTVLRLPRQDYNRYLFGFRILPLGSWPLSSSCAVFYFCRKSLTCLEGAGVGVMTQVPGFSTSEEAGFRLLHVFHSTFAMSDVVFLAAVFVGVASVVVEAMTSNLRIGHAIFSLTASPIKNISAVGLHK
ncbi:hypothetical protein F2Q69_00042534 [Brassica cretica]|uniref:Uncharacterized protein n=1 Tax=Brassica cretica TaxID=69181 RepID=A0A8S9N5U5_BRACR|nr:hypothetical protein F2Q69_00042534 [Brassica cretica]